MSLNDLEKKLYDPDSGIENRKHEGNQFDLSNPLIKRDSEVLSQEKKWEKIEDTGKAERKSIYKIGAIALGVIILIASFIVGYVKFREAAFKEGKVSIKIEGPAQVNGSEETKYKVIIRNDNRADLNNIQALLNYSENFKPKENQDFKISDPTNGKITLETLKGHSARIVEVSGEFFAAKDEVIYLNANMEYAPSGFSAKFQTKGQLGVKVNSSTLFLEIEAPSNLADGNKVDYVINYRNDSEEELDEVRIKVDYPEDFFYLASNIIPEEGNNIWLVGNLKPGQEGKIVTTGNIKGFNEEVKTITAYIGYSGKDGKFIVYNRKDEVTKLAPTLLSISQSIEGQTNFNVDTGGFLRYVINYKNNGDIALKDVIITEEIDSRVLDFSQLKMDNGAYDAEKKTIIWKAAEVPKLANLAPNDSGQVSFSIRVLDRIPVEKPEDKNFTIISTAKIDSPTIPNPIGSNKVVASNTTELKLNSRLVLEENGYYKDDTIPNSGPLPLTVGQTTSYTIHWRVINVSNDVSDVKVVSSMPAWMKWTGKTYPSTESISFNERTNQIEWDLGSLKNGSGILDKAREVSFQINITPQVNQVGEAVNLLNVSTLTAKDMYTGVDAKVQVKEKDSRLTEDPSIEGRYKVTQ